MAGISGYHKVKIKMSAGLSSCLEMAGGKSASNFILVGRIQFLMVVTEIFVSLLAVSHSQLLEAPCVP